MLTLHNLGKNTSNRKKKRVGRGNASGSGNYSTRGMKGQRSRSGGKSGLAIRSIKSYLLRIPKVRGFKSYKKDMSTVNLYELEANFNIGDKITAKEILQKGLISTTANGLKVLSDGKLTKNFVVEANAFSKNAVSKIEKAGGQAVVVSMKKVEEKKEEKKEDDKKPASTAKQGEEVKKD